MNKGYIIGLLVASLLFAGCSEEKTFKFEGRISNRVAFRVENVSVGPADSAESGIMDRWTERPVSEWREDSFTIDLYNTGDGYDNQDYVTERFSLNQTSMIWVGGDNRIKITFMPSCSEEKEAVFSMPDGNEYTLTASDSVLYWTLSRDTYNQIVNASGNRNEFLITAKSEFRNDGNIHNNSGGIILLVNESIQYNEGNGKWYYNSWTTDDILRLTTNVDFRAVNVTVGNHDWAESVIFRGWPDLEGDGTRKDLVEFPYYKLENGVAGRDTIGNFKEELYYKNQLWAGGDNDIRVTFNARVPEEKAIFTMPDGKEVTLTRDDDFFIWKLDHASAYGWDYTYDGYYSGMIQARSEYEYQGIRYVAHGYIVIRRNDYMWFDRTSDRWCYYDWVSDYDSIFQK